MKVPKTAKAWAVLDTVDDIIVVAYPNREDARAEKPRKWERVVPVTITYEVGKS